MASSAAFAEPSSDSQRLTELRDELIAGESTRPADIADYGNLARGLMIYVSGKPFLFSREDIERIVLDPWTLNDSTRAKLEGLPPRLRLRLYSILAGQVDRIHWGALAIRPSLALGEGQPLRLSMDASTRKTSLDDLGRSVKGYFRTEEAVDLAFYYLSRSVFFPRTQDDWHGFAGQLVQLDLALGLAGLAGLAALNLGSVHAGGWLLESPRDRVRFGWFGSARKLGFAWNPILSAGMQMAMPGFDASVGWAERVRPGKVSERRGIELVVREHYLSLMSRAVRWETAAVAKARYVWDDGSPTHEDAVLGELKLYARKPSILQRPGLDFLMEGAIGSDFKGRHAADVSVGLENVRKQVAGAIRLVVGGTEGGPTDARIGVVLGGAIGEAIEEAELREVERTGARYRDALRELQDAQARYCIGADPVSERWLESARARVSAEGRVYAEARRLAVARNARPAGPMTEEEAGAAEVLPGPVTSEELASASDGRCRGVEAAALRP